MVIQVISSYVIGTLTNEQQGFFIFSSENDENGELQISDVDIQPRLLYLRSNPFDWGNTKRYHQ